MPYEQITETLIPRLRECRVERATLTGGEPTIHPRFIDVVSAFRTAEIQVGVCTNATTLDDRQIEALRQIGGVHCNVSLDGFRPQSHGKFRGDQESFHVTIATVRTLATAGLLQGLLCTPNSLAEDDEYRELCEFAVEYGAEYVLLNPLSSMGRGVKSRDRLAASEERMRHIRLLTDPFDGVGLDVVHIRFPSTGQPLAGCQAGTINSHRPNPRHPSQPERFMTSASLSFLTLNIGNPSAQRAERQLAWLATRPEHVLVLTETKASAGCKLLASAFAAADWHVTFPLPEPGEYGVMILSRVQAQAGRFGDSISYLPARAASVTLPARDGIIEVIGAYVPSRDAGREKTERKRKWLSACQDALAARRHTYPAVFVGDLNILEPGHKPHYPFFAPFEYDFYRALTAKHDLADAFRHLHPTEAEHSWVGRTGDGYRYDHAFCSTRLADAITACEYLHEPRVSGLSDHSALTTKLNVSTPAELPVSDAATAGAPATLF